MDVLLPLCYAFTHALATCTLCWIHVMISYANTLNRFTNLFQQYVHRNHNYEIRYLMNSWE